MTWMAPFFFFPCHCVKYFGYRGKKISMSSSKSLSYCGDSQIKRKSACSKTSFLKEKSMMLYDTPKEHWATPYRKTQGRFLRLLAVFLVVLKKKKRKKGKEKMLWQKELSTQRQGDMIHNIWSMHEVIHVNLKMHGTWQAGNILSQCLRAGMQGPS